MTTADTKLLTADDLLRLHSECVRGELIQGVLFETMPTGREHGEIAANTAFELLTFVRPRRLGVVTTSDSGVRLERDPDTVREPDVAYFSGKRVGRGRVRGYSEIVPDLVVEIVSPSDDFGDVGEKARMWLSFGVELVWVVRPDDRSVDVHRIGQATQTLSSEHELDGLDVLPGFHCPVSAIFGDEPLEDSELH